MEVCGEGNAHTKRPCLGKGQIMLTKPPSQTEFEECWSEAIIKNGLSPSLVDDPLFRKALGGLSPKNTTKLDMNPV